MIRFLITLLLMAIFSASTPTLSQESDDSNADKTRPKTTNSESDSSPNTDPDNKPAAQDAGKTKPSGQVFKPSEEISEDSPVPFPVDI